ncbi:MAG: 16S rRNA (cytosine(967)-C(5))-methyltransferase RsmB [Eubacteriales bacterium]|nr:16S rRNA (cytosine(967)-C(5))-methyltransferase RsmB [Eubacteriales bacterium]
MSNSQNAREAALKILHKMRDGAYINAAVKEGLHQSMKTEDKALATQLVYGVVSNRTQLDYHISKFSKIPLRKISPWISDILRMGFYQLYFLDKIPVSATVNESVKLAKRYGHSASAGFVNGVLRRGAKDGMPPLPDDLSVVYSHPQWLVDMWISEYGEETTKKMLEANNQPPQSYVRVNTLKASAQQIATSLNGEVVDDLLVKVSSLGGIENSNEYKDGLITVQGRASAQAVKALGPTKGSLALDLCSAPGGKATLMAQMMEKQGEIIACDIYEHKLDIISKNAQRLGIDIIKTKLWDAQTLMKEYKGKADFVLADVPCSGLGTIRKKPDIRWDKQSEDIESLCKVQKNILNTASKYLKKGGRLVYSTCTVSRRENSLMIEEFLKGNSDFRLEYEKQYFPFEEGYDGFYIGVLLCKE